MNELKKKDGRGEAIASGRGFREKGREKSQGTKVHTAAVQVELKVGICQRQDTPRKVLTNCRTQGLFDPKKK